MRSHKTFLIKSLQMLVGGAANAHVLNIPANVSFMSLLITLSPAEVEVMN